MHNAVDSDIQTLGDALFRDLYPGKPVPLFYSDINVPLTPNPQRFSAAEDNGRGAPAAVGGTEYQDQDLEAPSSLAAAQLQNSLAEDDSQGSTPGPSVGFEDDDDSGPPMEEKDGPAYQQALRVVRAAIRQFQQPDGGYKHCDGPLGAPQDILSWRTVLFNIGLFQTDLQVPLALWKLILPWVEGQLWVFRQSDRRLSMKTTVECKFHKKRGDRKASQGKRAKVRIHLIQCCTLRTRLTAG